METEERAGAHTARARECAARGGVLHPAQSVCTPRTHISLFWVLTGVSPGICGTHICGMRTQFVAHILGNPTLDVALSSDN